MAHLQSDAQIWLAHLQTDAQRAADVQFNLQRRQGGD